MSSDAAHLFGPDLDYAVARKRLVCIIPTESQAPPELGVIPEPVMVESQNISAKMCSTGEHACL